MFFLLVVMVGCFFLLEDQGLCKSLRVECDKTTLVSISLTLAYDCSEEMYAAL